MFKRYQHVHMVGIGGSGMSGIAEVLLTLKYRVTGSDMKLGATTRRLARRGARIFRGHDRKHLSGAHVVVVSSAINGTNPEVGAAREFGIPVVPRAEMLAELMRLKWGIAVAGTHGKTSTTAMVAAILAASGLDPTIVNGGRVKSLRTNARLGRGDFLVAEADESDRSFLKLSPAIAVITNVDPEHLENYRNFDDLMQAFTDFANRVPFYGAVVACRDHPVVRKLLPHITRRTVTYGARAADFTFASLVQTEDRISFTVTQRGVALGRIALHLPGQHYALNALAAIAVARELDIPFATIRRGLKSFRGVARRFEILYRHGPIVVDDYGHHPAEIAATLAAARHGWPARRIIAVVQPHRFTRLKALFADFVTAFENADAIVVMEVYPAGEKPLAGWTGERLWKRLKQKYPQKLSALAPRTADVLKLLPTWCGEQDLVLFLGAGDVTTTARIFVKGLTSHA